MSDLRVYLRGFWSSLHTAASEGDCKAIEYLMKNGADIDDTVSFSSTPLHVAVEFNQKEQCFETLLNYKPLMYKKDHRGDTSFLKLLKKFVHSETMLDKFLAAGADPNEPDATGNSPLHIIAMNGPMCFKDNCRLGNKIMSRNILSRKISYTNALLKYNVDLDVQNKEGNTPLHIAITEGFEELVEILLNNGARTDIINQIQRTQFHEAYVLMFMYPKIFKHFGKKLIMQNVRNIPVNVKYLEGIVQLSGLKSFKRKCEKEYDRLKCQRIGKSSITYYDFLVEPPHKIAKYLRNPDIMKKMSSFTGKRYSVFGGNLRQNFRKGVERFEEKDVLNRFFREVSPRLPEDCTTNIFEYLNKEDITNMRKAIETENKDS